MPETLKGKLSELPESTLLLEKDIVRMCYEENKSPKEIKEELNLGSVGQVNEVLRRDMLSRVKQFKKINKDSPDFYEARNEIINFLKFTRKLDYVTISEMLGIDRLSLFKIVSEITTCTSKNALTKEERRIRDNAMKSLALQGYSLQEIGNRAGISRQRVSRIFNEMGFKPIKGTRQIKMKSSLKQSELNKLMMKDFNDKLAEMNEKCISLRAQYGTLKIYHLERITEVRCKYLREIMKHPTLLNYEEYVNTRRLVRATYNKWKENNKSSKYVDFASETLDLVANYERTKCFKNLTEVDKKQK